MCDDDASEPATLATFANLKLLAWFSPSFPIGSFAYSHALEWAAESGAVKTREDLQEWLQNILTLGAGHQDAQLLAASFHATQVQDFTTLTACNALALALPATEELLLETQSQGTAFYRAIVQSWPHEALATLPFAIDTPLAYPVAVGAVAACHGVPLAPTLNAYLHGFAAMVISAAQRLSLIGQSEGQRLIASVLPTIAAVAQTALTARMDEEGMIASLGGCAYGVDIASSHHANQYSRLFRS